MGHFSSGRQTDRYVVCSPHRSLGMSGCCLVNAVVHSLFVHELTLCLCFFFPHRRMKMRKAGVNSYSAVEIFLLRRLVIHRMEREEVERLLGGLGEVRFHINITDVQAVAVVVVAVMARRLRIFFKGSIRFSLPRLL